MSEATGKAGAERATDESTLKEKGEREAELNKRAAEEGQEPADPPEAQDDAPTDPDVLRGEIAEAREALGDTVEALAAKADVKTRAKDKADELKGQAQTKVDETAGQVRENPAPVVAGGLLALLLLLFLLRRRG